MPMLSLSPNNGLYYEYQPPEAGQATVVFVNALTGNTAAWQAVVGPACRAAGLGTLCYNFRGQVDSPFTPDLNLNAELIVADLSTLLAQIKPPKVVLCGLSIGGLFAAQAVLQGVQASGLVLLNTLRQIGPRLDWVNAATLQAVTVGGFPLLMDLFLPLLVNEEFLAKHRGQFLTSTQYTAQDTEHGHYKLMAAAGDANWDIPYEQLSLPVLTITGLQDRVFFDRSVVEALRQRLPQAQHIEWTDAGHLLPQEWPERLAEALIDFAQSLNA